MLLRVPHHTACSRLLCSLHWQPQHDQPSHSQELSLDLLWQSQRQQVHCHMHQRLHCSACHQLGLNLHGWHLGHPCCRWI
jgi:hypothetical protein